ncbi:complement C3-like [Antedon mediterranea]|uniref:complement C3-like n=1 Tax=Antedon mediterranea TaxID=105859 RepID=UPI003AF9F9CC
MDSCPINGSVVIECSGEGVAQAQVEVIYNSQADTPGEECAFFIFAQMIELEAEAGAENKLYRLDVTVNRYQFEMPEKTVIVEVGLLAGFTPVKSTLDNLVAFVKYPVERYVTSDRKVTLYLEKLTTELTTLPFNVEQTSVTVNDQSASITVYDHNFPETKCTTYYNPRDDDQTEWKEACEGDVCVCTAGPCPMCGRSRKNRASRFKLYKESCSERSGIDYVFEVAVEAVDVRNGFITLTATVTTRIKEGTEAGLKP